MGKEIFEEDVTRYVCDYTRLFPKGDEIRGEALRFNEAIIEANHALSSMHITWGGLRWVELASMWNSLMPFLNDTLVFLVKTVPNVIEVNSCNYASVDGTSVGEPQVTNPNLLDRELNTQTGNVKITLSDVTAKEERKYQKELDDCFKKAIHHLGEMANILNSTKGCDMWEGPAASNTRNNFAETKENIETSFKKMNIKVITCIDNAIKDLQTQDEDAAANANVLK